MPNGGFIARYNATNYSTLSSFQLVTSIDSNSQNVDPLFLTYLSSPFNLRLLQCLIAPSINAVDHDYNYAKRFNLYSLIGAFEYLPQSANVECWNTSNNIISWHPTFQSIINCINTNYKNRYTGDLILKINANLVETSTLTLTSSAYSSILIFPTLTGLHISGDMGSLPVFYFNGAKNITIDGRLNGTGANNPVTNLTISNTSISSGNHPIINYNNANPIVIRYCTIKNP
jgi:hypothetical protein